MSKSWFLDIDTETAFSAVFGVILEAFSRVHCVPWIRPGGVPRGLERRCCAMFFREKNQFSARGGQKVAACWSPAILRWDFLLSTNSPVVTHINFQPSTNFAYAQEALDAHGGPIPKKIPIISPESHLLGMNWCKKAWSDDCWYPWGGFSPAVKFPTTSHSTTYQKPNSSRLQPSSSTFDIF